VRPPWLEADCHFGRRGTVSVNLAVLQESKYHTRDCNWAKNYFVDFDPLTGRLYMVSSVHNSKESIMSGKYRKVVEFDNGYGASIVSGPNSYGGEKGLFEVAVLDSNGELCYTTPVTNDVIGWLDFAGVAEVLEKIKNLAPLRA
jgi:hypothetical protein